VIASSGLASGIVMAVASNALCSAINARPKGLAPLINWMGLYAAFWRDRFDDLETC
jgi:hypothetical protein